MMITKVKGDVTVGVVLAELLHRGHSVLIPLGENHRYDLVAEKGGRFLRVQCKTAKLVNGYITFQTASTNKIQGKWVRRDYRGDIDLFGVFCPDTGGVYLIPVNDVPMCQAHLLAERVKGQKRHVPMASKYSRKGRAQS